MKRKPKGPIARRRASKRRKDLARQTEVARFLSGRDGLCRLEFMAALDRDVFAMVGACEGFPEPAHIGEKRRCHTRGMAPEQRHDRQWEIVLCSKHHRMYDAHVFEFEYWNPELGADAKLELCRPDGEIIEHV